MADIEYTPNLALAKQPTGAREWGTVLNENFDKIDQSFGRVVDYDDITNCILEVPQDIKLELVDSLPILKADSKVYMPAGFEADGVTPKFEVVVVESDMQAVIPDSNRNGAFLTYNVNGRGTNLYHWSQWNAKDVYSGPTAPTASGNKIWYDTTNNIIKEMNDGTNWEILKTSFPFCTFSGTPTAVTSIDRVFNGCGYIGSTVFALPGVKGLIPNGRNEDGSLKNIETSTKNVATLTFASNITTPNNGRFLLNSTGGIFARIGGYDAVNNYNLGSNGVDILLGCSFAEGCLVEAGVIKTFQPKLPFRAADYNDVAKLDEDNLFHGVVTSDVGTINFVAQNNSIQKGVTPASNQFVGYDFRGANGDRLAYLGVEYNAKGTKQATLQRIDTNLTKLNSGFPISTPTPAVATNDTTVATTNYVNQKIQLVSALPSSPNANIFYCIPG